MINASLIIAAAGSSNRMGLEKNKTLLEISGLSVLDINIKQWLACKEIKEIIILYNERDYDAYRKIVSKYKSANISLIEGGKTRRESIKNGLLSCDTTSSHVLIHDGARPFISKKVITTIINNLKNHDIVSTYQKTVDTSYYGNYNNIELIDRNKIIRALTPQCFSKEIAIKMLEEMEKNTKEYTDEISLALSLGYHPTFVEADRFLFKLTTPDDYEIAKLIYNYLRGHEICV